MAKVYEAMILAQEQAPAATKQFLNDYNFSEVAPEPHSSVNDEDPLDLGELGLAPDFHPVSEVVEKNVAVAEAIADSVDSLTTTLHQDASATSPVVVPLQPRQTMEVPPQMTSPQFVPEAYRAEFLQLSEIVSRAATQRTLKAITVCGVEPSDHADFVVENLSLALAENPSLRIARFRLVSASHSATPASEPANFRIKMGRTAISNLCEVVPVNGMLPIAQLLRECDIEQMINMLKERFDFILLETDAVNFDDAVATFAGSTDGVILVAQKDNMRGTAMNFAREKLQNCGARILGAVLNRNREPEQLQRVA